VSQEEGGRAFAAEQVLVEFDAEMVADDGVILRANVFKPTRNGPWPALLMRTPYGKDDLSAVAWTGLDPVQAARSGLMVVVQDTRGRFQSDGVWDPYIREGADGAQAVAWVAERSDSNGRVAMYGGSYHGNTQWLAAAENPPGLVAISPFMTWCHPLDGLAQRGGANELALSLQWGLATEIVQELNRAKGFVGPRAVALIEQLDGLSRGLARRLPNPIVAALEEFELPDIGERRGTPRVLGEFLSAVDHQAVEVPVLTTGGWYDLFLGGTLANHMQMVELGRESHLVVGPWSHQRFCDPVGDVELGQVAARDGLGDLEWGNWQRTQMAWLLEKLGPEPHATRPTVRIFTMGENEWQSLDAWPPPDRVDESWFLASDGLLSPDAPTDSGTTTYIYDPADPVPTYGGNGVLIAGYGTGPVDQRKVEERADVLVFTSTPLTRDVEVTGPVEAWLEVESSALSTDWVVRLCDVYPDGSSINLCDGITRVVDQGWESGPVRVDLWATSNVFKRGHRIRVQVTSSCFPRWDRNLNTGNQAAASLVTARQVVHHSNARPSRIVLPTRTRNGAKWRP
jgi:putative CocE/NonD family hydrolase